MNPANEALLDALSETAWSARSEAALQDDSVEIIRGVIYVNTGGRQLRLTPEQARALAAAINDVLQHIEDPIRPQTTSERETDYDANPVTNRKNRTKAFNHGTHNANLRRAEDRQVNVLLRGGGPVVSCD